ncbi:MAG: carboxypeptidase-like regulatory domain-containing protein, partial [Burkholderiales bacterium]|nr:carboxypeptidase-like regulatory domain-containing protein [Flavobacterium sp.]
MKSNCLLIYFLLLTTLGFSQGNDLGGIVKESDSGAPIPGVNVTVRNSTKSTTTDIDGKFSLKDISSSSILVFSYLGYKDQTFKVIESNSKVIIGLIADVQSLDQVVVIGYGSQK